MRSFVKSGTAAQIHAAGGEIFGLTSEPQTLATEAEQAWELGYPCVGDPHHEIRHACRDKGFVGVFANENFGHLWTRRWASHPKGYFQPAVLAVARGGRVLYRWRCRPTHENMSGAGQRPTPEYVWEEIRSRLEAAVPDPELDERPEFAREDVSWTMFVALMLAHGWFLRPRAFPLPREGDRPSARPQKMRRRMVLFALAWVAAFALLPTAWVALAFFAWVAVAGVGVATVNRQFQNVTEGEVET